MIVIKLKEKLNVKHLALKWKWWNNSICKTPVNIEEKHQINLQIAHQKQTL